MDIASDAHSSSWRTTHYIDGAWAASAGRTFPSFNPFDSSVFAEVSAGGRAEAEAAVAAANAAFPAWAAMLPRDRQRLFFKAADIIEVRTDALVSLLARETGTGNAFARFQLRWASDLLRQAGGWGYRPVGEVLRSDTPDRFAMATRKPLGVVAGFSPWNGAFSLAWRTVVLPMAFGNTVVLKPSEEAPISAGLVLAEIFEEAGLPAGVLNVVTHAAGEAGPIADVFFESPAVRSINFTGSSKTGRMLAERAGRALKRIVLELGGYNPTVVLDDADLDHAVDATVFGSFFHQGQICMNTRKIIVERPIYDDFLRKMIARTNSLIKGDPTDSKTVIGPLINATAMDAVKRTVGEAVSKGATVLAGGTFDGPIYHPTILAGVPQDATIATEETFGPVVIIEAADSAEEALERALATRYGLCASLMTGNRNRGLNLAQKFDCGMIHVNGPSMVGEPALPNGGVKDSGWGRSGYYAIEDFTEIRLTTLTNERGLYPV